MRGLERCSISISASRSTRCARLASTDGFTHASQGRQLPVPELVPFRLTADVVDGMGIAGTEGVFRRCSEETLRVLREKADIIRTVLEVFRYDPLHSW